MLGIPRPVIPLAPRNFGVLVQMILLEQQQSSNSTPVLSYFNAETDYSSVSVGHGSCDKTTCSVMQLLQGLHQKITCDHCVCFIARLLILGTICMLGPFLLRGATDPGKLGEAMETVKFSALKSQI